MRLRAGVATSSLADGKVKVLDLGLAKAWAS
jgi:hypothetical protein